MKDWPEVIVGIFNQGDTGEKKVFVQVGNESAVLTPGKAVAVAGAILRTAAEVVEDDEL